MAKSNLRLVGPCRWASCLALVSACALATAADWPHWRGPAFNGSSTETNLPASWSKTENVAWVLDMPGTSAATPIVHGNTVFLPSTDRASGGLVALAVDRTSGKVLWQKRIADTVAKDDMSNYASPSATTDGKRVVFFYGNGDLAAFDFGGNAIWARNLQKEGGEFAFQWTFSASPTLHDERLFLQVLQRDVPVNGHGRAGGPIESYVLAVDPATGKDLWRQGRTNDAVAESKESYATPIPVSHAGRNELIVAGGDCLTGHDVATGKELWRWGTWNPSKIGHWRYVPSPVAADGVVLACAPKRDPVYAIKLGGSGRLDDSAIAWKTDQAREVSSDVPTPLVYQGDFFVLSDVRKSLARVEPATGKVKWLMETPGQAKYEASPTGADGRIFLINFKGEVVVVDAANGKVLQQIAMGDEGDNATRSTIAISHGQIFIRTNRKLYCIGKGA